MDRPHATQQDLTALLLRSGEGDGQALELLLPQVYHELRRMALQYMKREGSGHTLQATALVHEAYIRLIDQTRVQWQNRAHFFAIAAQAIRRILIDHARAKQAEKRGSGEARLEFDDDLHANPELAAESAKRPDLLALDQALERLKQIDERQARVVEYRYFGGLSIEQTAEALGASPATVKRDWLVARAWLKRELDRGADTGSR